jgi:hypothetical protein
MAQLYELTVQATGEVRDADGNLLSSEPVESKITVTQEQARDLGLLTDQGE